MQDAQALRSVQEGMAELARGNPAVQHYGDLIVNEETCDRFLQGSKGNVGHAIAKVRRTYIHTKSRCVHGYMDKVAMSTCSDLEALFVLFHGFMMYLSFFPIKCLRSSKHIFNGEQNSGWMQFWMRTFQVRTIRKICVSEIVVFCLFVYLPCFRLIRHKRTKFLQMYAMCPEPCCVVLTFGRPQVTSRDLLGRCRQNRRNDSHVDSAKTRPSTH